MDELYRQAYEGIYAARVQEPARLRAYFEQFGPRTPDYRQLGAVIEESLTRAERARQRLDGALVRDDAKALLAVNFQDLVFVPLLAGGRVPNGVLRDDVQQDIEMLVSEAEASRNRTPSRRPGAEVTGHGIIDSLSRNWENMRISRFNLWEDTSRASWELS
jgi:hypothetical protein